MGRFNPPAPGMAGLFIPPTCPGIPPGRVMPPPGNPPGILGRVVGMPILGRAMLLGMFAGRVIPPAGRFMGILAGRAMLPPGAGRFMGIAAGRFMGMAGRAIPPPPAGRAMPPPPAGRAIPPPPMGRAMPPPPPPRPRWANASEVPSPRTAATARASETLERMRITKKPCEWEKSAGCRVCFVASNWS